LFLDFSNSKSILGLTVDIDTSTPNMVAENISEFLVPEIRNTLRTFNVLFNQWYAYHKWYAKLFGNYHFLS